MTAGGLAFSIPKSNTPKRPRNKKMASLWSAVAGAASTEWITRDFSSATEGGPSRSLSPEPSIPTLPEASHLQLLKCEALARPQLHVVPLRRRSHGGAQEASDGAREARLRL